MSPCYALEEPYGAESHWDPNKIHRPWLRGTIVVQGTIGTPTDFTSEGPCGAESHWDSNKFHKLYL